MMNKKILSAILILLAVSLCLIACTAANTDASTAPPEIDSALLDPQNRVEASKLSQVQVGMTYAQVTELLGKANREVGSGFWVLEYDSAGADYMYLWLVAGENDQMVVDHIEISSYRLFP